MDAAKSRFEPEPEELPLQKARNKCKKCGNKIKDVSHQSKGKHIDICINCYSEIRNKKKSKSEKERKRSKKERDK